MLARLLLFSWWHKRRDSIITSLSHHVGHSKHWSCFALFILRRWTNLHSIVTFFRSSILLNKRWIILLSLHIGYLWLLPESACSIILLWKLNPMHYRAAFQHQACNLTGHRQMLSHSSVEVVQKLFLRAHESFLVCVNILVVICFFLFRQFQKWLIKHKWIGVKLKLNRMWNAICYIWAPLKFQRLMEVLMYFLITSTTFCLIVDSCWVHACLNWTLKHLLIGNLFANLSLHSLQMY